MSTSEDGMAMRAGKVPPCFYGLVALANTEIYI